METNEKLASACWEMWGAIQQAHSLDIYNEHVSSIYNVAKTAMTRAGLIDLPTKGTDNK